MYRDDIISRSTNHPMAGQGAVSLYGDSKISMLSVKNQSYTGQEPTLPLKHDSAHLSHQSQSFKRKVFFVSSMTVERKIWKLVVKNFFRSVWEIEIG